MNGEYPTNNNGNGQNPFGNNTLGSTTLGSTSLGPSPMPNQNDNMGPMPTPMPNQVGVNPANPTPLTNDNMANNVNNMSNQDVNPTTSNLGFNQNPTPTDFNQVNSTTGVSNINQNPMNTSYDMNQNMNNMSQNNPEPVARPIPGTFDNLTSNTVGSNNQYNINSNNNGFVEPIRQENIGSVPPPVDNSKKKKPMNKILFLILILILIGVVAFGVYYFLSISNSIKVTPKTVTIGIGSTVPDKLSDYATVTKGDASTCQVNTKNVDSSKIGNYTVTITCGKNTYESKVVVSDITAPTVELTPVFKTVNSTVTVEDFVTSCVDPSNCTTKFANKETVDNYLSTAGGPYSVEIIAEDTAGNSETYKAELYVTSNPILAYTNCSASASQVNNYQASKVITDILPMGYNDQNVLSFLNVARRNIVYTFTSKDEYNEVVKDKSSTITFDGVTGNATYDDNTNTLTIASDLPVATLNSENNNAFPATYAEIITLYNAKGYTCANQSALSAQK